MSHPSLTRILLAFVAATVVLLTGSGEITHAQDVTMQLLTTTSTNFASFAHCIQHLIDHVCTDGINQCAELTHSLIAEQCAAPTIALTTALPTLSLVSTISDTKSSTDPILDPCGADSIVVYNRGLHIGGVFIILAASLIGAGLPVLGKYIPFFAVHPFLLVLGKCLGIGIILACALVHMLQPATEELSSECLSKAFTEDYGAYPFLFAMLAIILMHFIDFSLESLINNKLEGAMRVAAASDVAANHTRAKLPSPSKTKYGSSDDNPFEDKEIDAVITTDALKSVNIITVHQVSDDASPDPSSSSHGSLSSKLIQVVPIDQVNDDDAHKQEYQAHLISEQEREIHANESDLEAAINGRNSSSTTNDNTPLSTSSPMTHNHADHEYERIRDHAHAYTYQNRHSHGMKDASGHGHVHSVLLLKGMKRTVSAYMLEFGVTSHSIFIGLTTGIVDESGLRALLVALVFHQAFEGVALGSRIVEAELGSRLEEIFMVCIFSFAAPLGMAIGICVTSSFNPNGATYNYTAGIFDSICAGILLYIGLVLLLKDFPEDVARYCKDSMARKYAMFIALWTGAGVMAYIGKYL